MLAPLGGINSGGGGGGSSSNSYIVYNVQTYGADPTNGSNSVVAIQAAIDAAAANAASGRGSVVYFPKGEYKVSTTGIILPRIGWPAGSGTISLVGDGIGNTSISDSGALAAATPLIRYAATPTGTAAAHMVFQEMSWGRSSDGTVFEHTKPTSDPVTERLIRCRFQDLYIRGKTSSGTYPIINIDGGIECIFDNVWGDGGSPWANIKNSSHMQFRGFGTTNDTYCVNGILIDGGGNNLFTQIRVEGTSGGYGVRLTNGAGNNTFMGIAFEGKLTTPQIDLDSCQENTFFNPAIAAPSAASKIGIYASPTAYANLFINGVYNTFSGQATSYTIKADSGARNNKFIGGYYYGYASTDLNLSATAYNTIVSGYTGGVASDPFTVTAGVYQTITATGSSVKETNYFNVTYAAGGNLDNLIDGYEGQVIYLIFTNGNCTVRHAQGAAGQILLSGAANFTGSANDTLVLQFNGTSWFQTGGAVI